ncbi:MAG: molybdate ABC transporter substrate-binding protein [Devosia sp.]
MAWRHKIPGLFWALALLIEPTAADEVKVAVAANFAAAAEELAIAFEVATGDGIVLSTGATGALYTQISQGAPFEVFLAADNARPQMAVDEGLGIEGTAFTYALGSLVLYSPSLDLASGIKLLQSGEFEHLAIADPETAPYGAAAVSVLRALGIYDALAPKFVIGESIAQTLLFVQSGNAELGFVALSQVIGEPEDRRWLAPGGLHRPIEQDAVLLKPGEDNPVASAFLAFLKGEEARAIIRNHGYDVSR